MSPIFTSIHERVILIKKLNIILIILKLFRIGDTNVIFDNIKFIKICIVLKKPFFTLYNFGIRYAHETRI